MARYEVRLKDLLRGNGPGIQLTPGGLHTVAIRRQRADFIEFADTLFRNNSGVLLPSETAPSADGVPHPGLDVVASCFRYARANPDKKILITGHTDSVGSDEANVRLSQIRAQSAHGMIVGLRDQFAEACWGPHLTAESRYPNGGDGSKKGVLWDDYGDVLNWISVHLGWPCRTGYPKSPPWLYDATLQFQSAYNASDLGPSSAKPLKRSGKFDVATWGAVYDCYESKLAEALHTDLAGLAELRAELRFVKADQPWVGCGEFKTVDQVGRDNYRSQKNRRVEVLFFDPGEESDLPCLAAACQPAACELYDLQCYKRDPVPLWVASWEPHDFAGVGMPRKMVVDAPDLPDGVPVTFSLSQKANGLETVVGNPAVALLQGGRAGLEFGEWFDKSRVTYQVDLKDGESFPPVVFRFKASLQGKEVQSAPLAYSDSIGYQCIYDNDVSTPVADQRFTVLSPWGTLRGRTDAQGNLRVDGLPPGGAQVVLAGCAGVDATGGAT